MKNFEKVFSYLKPLGKGYLTYLEFFLKYYVKLHIFILNKIAFSYLLYSVYILFMIHGYYSGMNQVENHDSYQWVSLSIVSYLQVISVEMFIVCQVIIVKEYLLKLVGKEFFLTNFPKKGQLVFKFLFPYFWLLAVEVLTIKLRYSFVSYLSRACTLKYKEIYGNDIFVWSDLTKHQYHMEQGDILSGSNQGLVSSIADDINVLVNFLMESILNFL